jgi:hypothetical protein
MLTIGQPHRRHPGVDSGDNQRERIQAEQKQSAVQQPNGGLHFRPHLCGLELRPIAEVAVHHSPARESGPEWILARQLGETAFQLVAAALVVQARRILGEQCREPFTNRVAAKDGRRDEARYDHASAERDETGEAGFLILNEQSRGIYDHHADGHDEVRANVAQVNRRNPREGEHERRGALPPRESLDGEHQPKQGGDGSRSAHGAWRIEQSGRTDDAHAVGPDIGGRLQRRSAQRHRQL